jgi:hypothetical protein
MSEGRSPTFVLNVWAANSFAAGGASGDLSMRLQVVHASDCENGVDGGESEVVVEGPLEKV